MVFKNIFEDLNISRNDFFYLFVLTIFSILITYVLINFNENIGIYCSDVFVYLTNSLIFAGYTSSRTYLYLSPLICFLTSILFRLGFLSESSLYVVTGIFCILGNFGIYVFLKNRFDSLLSLFGGFLFGSFSLNLLWWANGALDLPAVALSIWTIIFAVLAIDKDSKYYILAVPLLILAIFTRYTALFLIPLLLLYYLSYHDFFTNLDLLFKDKEELCLKVRFYFRSYEFKNLARSFAIAFVLIIIFSTLILAFGSHLTFLTQSSTFASGSKGAVIDNAYTNDTFFYLHEFPNFLFSDYVSFDNVIPCLNGSNFLSYVLIGLFVLGIIFFIYRLFSLNSRNKLQNNHNSSKNKYWSFKSFVWILFGLMLIASILSFRINSIITLSILLIDFVILFSLLKKNGLNRDDYSLNILILAWFLVYFIFFTFLNIKVNRYIITVFPAFIYFVIFAINEILEITGEFKMFEFKNENILNVIPIILIVFCVFSAFSFTSNFHYDGDFNKNKVIADYLIDYDPDYASKDIAVFNQRSLNWFLKDNTIALLDNQLGYLESSNITYYISDDNFKLENYTMIHQEDGLYLYERIK